VIHLTKLNGRSLVINADLIEQIEATPDTVITLTSGSILMVHEPVEEVVRRVMEYRRSVFQTASTPNADAAAPEMLHG
jgi:flagellar protein FlbD